MQRLVSVILVIIGLVGAPALAVGQDVMSEGEVTKVNKPDGKLTIKHGPLQNLDMPAMTMVFRVADPAWLDQLVPGDKIKFVAEKVAGTITITRIENGP